MQYDAEEKTGCTSQLCEFVPGDLVLVRNFGKGDRWLEGSVFKRTGAVDYEVLVSQELLHRHVDQMRGRSVGPDEGLEDDNVELDGSSLSVVEEGLPGVVVKELPRIANTNDELPKGSEHGSEEIDATVLTPVRKSTRTRRPPSWLESDYVKS